CQRSQRSPLNPRPCTRSVPQHLPRLQRVLNALERFPLATELQKRLTLQVEQILLADGALMRKRAAGKYGCERPADERVVIADLSGAPGQVDSELQRGQ